MTAENRSLKTYDLEFIENQLKAMGYKKWVIFLDQNFCAGSRANLMDRIQ